MCCNRSAGWEHCVEGMRSINKTPAPDQLKFKEKKQRFLIPDTTLCWLLMPLQHWALLIFKLINGKSTLRSRVAKRRLEHQLVLRQSRSVNVPLIKFWPGKHQRKCSFMMSSIWPRNGAASTSHDCELPLTFHTFLTILINFIKC